MDAHLQQTGSSGSAQIVVFARWRCYVEPIPPTRTFTKKIHLYEAVYQPSKPLLSGAPVRIIAVSPMVYHVPGALPMHFDTYDPHIHGRVTRVDTDDGEVVVYSVQNECVDNPVKSVKLVVAESVGVLMPAPRHLQLTRDPRTTVIYPPVSSDESYEPTGVPYTSTRQGHVSQASSYMPTLSLVRFGWKG